MGVRGRGFHIPHHFWAIVKFDYNWYFRVFTSGIQWDFLFLGWGLKLKIFLGYAWGKQ